MLTVKTRVLTKVKAAAHQMRPLVVQCGCLLQQNKFDIARDNYSIETASHVRCVYAATEMNRRIIFST